MDAQIAPRRRIYIAGPMTGYPGLNFTAFNVMAQKLHAEGWDPVNPVGINKVDPDAEHSPDDRHTWLRRDIEALLKCEAIMLLAGWQQSKGARVESLVAEACGMTFLHEEV